MIDHNADSARAAPAAVHAPVSLSPVALHLCDEDPALILRCVRALVDRQLRALVLDDLRFRLALALCPATVLILAVVSATREKAGDAMGTAASAASEAFFWLMS